ncbi:MAG: DUF3800 domain-containing protein [Bacteroidetes bacterium]|nr:DUF3800 domain-containing protein [Bacteroidota bacterium]
MLICYLDESGTPETPGTTSHYILAGIAIPIAKWKNYEGALRKLKSRYALEGKEIHSAYIPRPIIEQNNIPDFEKLTYQERTKAVVKLRNIELLRLKASPRTHKQYKQTLKNFRQTEEYIHLSINERKNLLEELSVLISKWPDVRLFADCIDKVHFDEARAKRTIEEEAFIQVISRFEQYLKIYTKTSSDAKCGIIVHDNNQTMSDRLGTMMRNFQENGTLWTSIKNIIETPFFVDSKAVNMVQIADLCSFALRRYVENQEEILFNNIFQIADRKDNKTVGVRHFTVQPCNCIICKSHS